MATPDSQTHSFPHDSASLEAILHSAREFAGQAGADPKQVDKVEQAVEEAFSIALQDGAPAEPMVVVFEGTPEAVVIELADAGPAYPAVIGQEEIETRLLFRLMDKVVFRNLADSRRAIRLELKVAAPHESTAGLVIDEKHEGKQVLFVLDGRLDSRTSPRLLERVNSALAVGPEEILFDCKKLEYISSAGVRVWMIAARALKSPHRVALIAAAPRILQVLELAGCHRLFPSFANLAAANLSKRQGL